MKTLVYRNFFSYKTPAVCPSFQFWDYKLKTFVLLDKKVCICGFMSMQNEGASGMAEMSAHIMLTVHAYSELLTVAQRQASVSGSSHASAAFWLLYVGKLLKQGIAASHLQ